MVLDATLVYVSAIGLLCAAYTTSASSLPFPNFPGGDPTNQHQMHPQSIGGACVNNASQCACPNYQVFYECIVCRCDGYPTTNGASTMTSSKPPAQSAQTTTQPSQIKTTSTSLPTTSAPMTTSTPIPTTPAPTTSTVQYCDVAKRLCTAHCPGGYLVDPDDCTYCLCKADVMMG